ncbi:MAG: DUF4296 domain-containing protein [Flavobacteriaceae bacterium]|nr:DUF4296 domain-containing protein [Flavobacteriaceae bacterium]
MIQRFVPCKITLFLLICSVFACHSSPNRVSDEKMIAILADAMVLEASNQIQYDYATLPDSVWLKEYSFVCKKHAINFEDFKSQLHWLKENPDEFSPIMEKVITRLQWADLNAKKVAP